MDEGVVRGLQNNNLLSINGYVTHVLKLGLAYCWAQIGHPELLLNCCYDLQKQLLKLVRNISMYDIDAYMKEHYFHVRLASYTPNQPNEANQARQMRCIANYHCP